MEPCARAAVAGLVVGGAESARHRRQHVDREGLTAVQDGAGRVHQPLSALRGRYPVGAPGHAEERCGHLLSLCSPSVPTSKGEEDLSPILPLPLCLP